MEITFDSIRDIRLYQSKIGYRFSVDSLLLYSFINLKKVKTIADLGAGTGIVGMLLAKKYPEAKVTLFEIQDGLVTLAEKNIIQNCLEDRMKVIKCDIRILPSHATMPGDFNLVISNPPFRKLKSGRLNIEEEKAIARHEIKLRLKELVKTVSSLLRVKGRFCVIYHPSRLSELIETLRRADLEPKRLRFVHSHISSDAKMVLMEAVKNGKAGLKVDKPLYLYKKNGNYTKELQEIYALERKDVK
jgi:tRNA1Val (adenine37-N6)-methyltransferase